MFNHAEVKPHYLGSFQDAQHAASAGSMRPPRAMLGCRPLLRPGKPRRYLLDHRHTPDECAAMHASWSGFAGRLRQGVTAASCAQSGHGIWGALDAADETDALAQLPRLVAERTRAIGVA